jgi:hypothetical protein
MGPDRCPLKRGRNRCGDKGGLGLCVDGLRPLASQSMPYAASRRCRALCCSSLSVVARSLSQLVSYLESSQPYRQCSFQPASQPPTTPSAPSIHPNYRRSSRLRSSSRRRSMHLARCRSSCRHDPCAGAAPSRPSNGMMGRHVHAPPPRPSNAPARGSRSITTLPPCIVPLQ